MCEVGAGVTSDICFKLIPVTFGIVNPLADGTYSQEPPQIGKFAFSRLVESTLGFHAIGHVNATSDVALKFAALGVERNATIENPSKRPVGATGALAQRSRWNGTATARSSTP